MEKTGAPVELIIYTDPLCCWTFVMGKQIEEFRQHLGEGVQTRYCMAGLIPSWKHFHDPVQMVTKPIQMGPVWHEASIISGIKLDDKLWFKDPPSSSYTACLAVKAAGFQTQDIEKKMFELLQQAVMVNGINISKLPSILEIAQQLQQNSKEFDLQRFSKEITEDKTIEAFRKDMEEIAVKGITRFPSILVRFENGRSTMISGYRKLEELLSCTVINQ